MGDASAVALALETPDSVLLVDDYRGRMVAQRLGIEIISTVGLFIRAKQLGVIPLLRPYLDRLVDIGFRLSNDLISEAMEEAGE